MGIFDRIQKSAFSLKEDDDARQQMSKQSDKNSQFDPSSFFKSSVDEKRRKEKEYQKERAELMASSETSLKNNNIRLSTTTNTNNNSSEDNTPDASEGVLPMFEVCWPATIGALSQILEFSEEPSCIALCLRGFVYAVRIAANNGLTVARDTFVNR